MQVDGYTTGEKKKSRRGPKTSDVITAVKIPWKQTNWPHTSTSMLLVRPTSTQDLALCRKAKLVKAMWVAVIKLIDQ
jgi:hypothetical protein